MLRRGKRRERFFLVMVMAMDCPGVQEVPAATDWTTDQLPLAHCWKEFPPMQFHIPSVVQAPVSAEPEPVVPVLAGAEAEAAALEAGCVAAALADPETVPVEGAAAVAEVAWLPPPAVGVVMKTPPEGAVFVPTTADDDWVAA